MIFTDACVDRLTYTLHWQGELSKSQEVISKLPKGQSPGCYACWYDDRGLLYDPESGLRRGIKGNRDLQGRSQVDKRLTEARVYVLADTFINNRHAS